MKEHAEEEHLQAMPCRLFARWSAMGYGQGKKNDCASAVLPGTKMDLREDKETLQQLSEQGLSPIKREQGQKLCSKIRAIKYLECSALTQRGLKQVRTRTCPLSFGPMSSSCCIVVSTLIEPIL